MISIYLSTKDKMDISLISAVVCQVFTKNENVYAQNSATCVKSTKNEDEIESFLSVNLPSTPQSMDIESTFDTLSIKKLCIKTLLIAASRFNASYTPHCSFLKRGIETLMNGLAITNLHLKTDILNNQTVNFPKLTGQ